MGDNGMGCTYNMYGEMRNVLSILIGKLEGNSLEQVGIAERIILKWVLIKYCETGPTRSMVRCKSY
jgi:hypothetical protein